MMKSSYILIILIYIMSSCNTSKKKNTQYIYTYKDSGVQLKIMNGNNYLTYDETIQTNFEWTNIGSALIYGTGIKILGRDKNITKTEIHLPSNYLKKDTLNIKLQFEVDGEKINTEFNIPIKKN